MRTREKDNNITCRTTDKAGDVTRAAEAEASQLRTGRHVPTSSHQKRMTEQAQWQFHAFRCRAARVFTAKKELALMEAECVHIVVKKVQVPIVIEEVTIEAEQVHVNMEEVHVASEQVLIAMEEIAVAAEQVHIFDEEVHVTTKQIVVVDDS